MDLLNMAREYRGVCDFTCVSFEKIPKIYRE